jgi:signal transduction histidine kinase
VAILKNNSKINKLGERVRFPYFVLAFSIILTIGATILFYQSAKSKDTARFNGSVNRIRSSMDNRIGLYVALLKAGRGFIESSSDLNRNKFANFVESLELEKNYFGAQGIGYAVNLQPADEEKLTLQMNAEGYENFKISPALNGKSGQIIIYLEPFNERNEKAIGFDMSSEQVRRTALEKARDTGIASATAKLILLQENEQDRQFGFLIYLPIYKNGQFPESLEARKQNLQGYIYSPFRANNFLRDVHNNAGIKDIAVKIYDGDSRAENLLVQSEAISENNISEPINGHFSTENEIEVAGRKWIVQYETLPSFAVQSSINWSPLIFLCGLIFSFLLFGMTYWEAATRAKLQETTNDLTESERQIQGLLEKEQEARRVAETANATKDEFISVVSHELRTPLNAIAGWTRILKSDELSKNTKELALQKIEKNLRLQTTLVEDLLSFSQLVSSNDNLSKAEIDLSEIFEIAYWEIESSVISKGITISKENSLNGQKIFGDAEKIKILVVNILSNAVKFTPDQGIIKTSLAEKNNCAELTIEDTGKGINSEFLPHIFDRFSQDDTSTTREFGGLGLGLAVSQHIVKLHNGTIEAKSEGEGKGSTFTVKLPLAIR